MPKRIGLQSPASTNGDRNVVLALFKKKSYIVTKYMSKIYRFLEPGFALIN